MSFSATITYANIVPNPRNNLRPDFGNDRTLKRRVLDAFQQNKTNSRADKLAVIFRVTHDKMMRLDVTVTDKPEKGQKFPYGAEIIQQRPIEKFASGLREPMAGSIKSIGFEFGIMMKRRDMSKNYSTFKRYQDFIHSDNLLPVVPV